MSDIPFIKYTSYGNNFVIIDETTHHLTTEQEKSAFAFQATNPFFGIGSDNLLVIQRSDRKTLSEINKARQYWREMPDPDASDFIFRMFEPNGEEAYSCGNGLMAIAHYLNKRYEIQNCRIRTEVPLEEPKVITIGVTTGQTGSWANMGQVRKIPENLVSYAVRSELDGIVDQITDIKVRFRTHDLAAYTDEPSLSMSGYLVFTGEPHLVIFPEESFSNPGLARVLFGEDIEDGSGRIRRRVSLGSWLVRRIGVFLNDSFPQQVPNGINVNFARVDRESQQVEYRCFERGINRETLACGTGAVAVVVVARRMGLLDETRSTTVLPHLCRWHDSKAEIKVIENEQGSWRLEGAPRMLFSGLFSQESVLSQLESAAQTDTMDIFKVEDALRTHGVAT